MKALSHKKIEMKWYEPVTIAVGFGLFIWFCIPFFFGIFNVGSYFGIAVSILAMAYFPVKRFCKRKMAQKPYFVTFSIVNFLAVIFGIWIAFLTGLMIFAINQVPLANVTAVVLGCPLEENELGPSLTARLDRAVEYLEENPTVNCVVTGGLGDKDTPSEAEVMYDYLVQKGISPERIEKDTSSRNTKENLANAKQIIQSKGWNQNIAIITEYYHEFRAGRLADELGMRSYAVCAETPWYIFSSSYGREVLALTKFFCHI